jgi:DNA polymerase
MFIGEAPGEEEDRQGVPFVGAAGHLLDKMIAAMQFKREDVYIANVVKCHPQKNRNPNPNEVAACLPFLLRQIEMVGPRVIVLLGAVPLAALFHKTGITRIHGEWLDFHGIPTLPTFHPAYLLRYADAKRQAWDDLKKVMQFLGKAPPQKPSRKP